MTDDEFRDWFNTLPSHELRDVEWKHGCPFSDVRYRLKIIRAIMGMSNLVDGGRVLLGPSDGNRSTVKWQTPSDIETWKHDELADQLRKYSSEAPPIQLYRREVTEGVVLEIAVGQFDSLPTICVCAAESVLQEGRIYVRPAGKAETVPAKSLAEFRYVFDAAFGRQVTRLRTVGIDVVPTATDEVAERAKEFFER